MMISVVYEGPNAPKGWVKVDRARMGNLSFHEFKKFVKSHPDGRIIAMPEVKEYNPAAWRAWLFWRRIVPEMGKRYGFKTRKASHA